jgi:prephenate dehydrogenase
MSRTTNLTERPVAPFRRVTVIGVGLLGGSLGLALRRRYRGVCVAGVGRRESSLAAAKKIGAIHSAHRDVAEAAADSDLIVLATPVGAFGEYLAKIKPLLKRGAVVTDVGSTKVEVVRLAERILGPHGPFVGSHPMAGSERKGPRFARADLFAGAPCIVTPTPNASPAKQKRVERLWRDLGMRVLRMSPTAHDRVVARVSHLPRLVSSLLMLLAADGDLEAASTGLRDMTRLAGGDVEMWRDILLTNRKPILAALERFDDQLCRLRDLVELGDTPGLERFLQKAKTRRDTTLDEK